MADSKGRIGTAKILIAGVVVLGIVGILGVSIAILVKVINNNKKDTEPVYITNTPVSEVSTSAPVNNATAPNNNNNQLGIPPRPTINPQDTNKTSVYKDFISLLKQNVKTTEDPCNDFWAYACGNIGNNQQSFGVLTDKNYRVMASQIANSNYVSKAPLPVQQVAHHYTQCVTDTANWDKIIGDGSIIIKMVQDFQNILNISMPAISDQGSGKTLSPDALGSALGYLSGQAYTNTLVSAIVDTNWKHPHTAPGYALYVDQSTLGTDNTYYQKPVAWQGFQDLYLNMTFLQVSTLAKLMNPNYNPSRQDPLLRSQITQVLYFEWSLANNYSTLDSVRRHYNRSYNPMTILEASAAYPFINWANFLDQLLVFAPPEVRSYALNDTKFKFIIMEPMVLQKIQTDLNDSQGAFGSLQTFINWLYIRLLQTNSMYIPVPDQSFVRKSISSKPKRSPLSKRPKVKAPTLPSFHPYDSVTDDTGYNEGCMDDNVFGIQYANARLFIDGLYPNQADRDVLRNNVAQFVTLILDSFQSMLNQLGWMDQSSKQGAYAKISNLVKNMAYPDFITNDTSLIAYYQNLAFSLTDDYVTISGKVNQFNQYLNFALLDKNKVVDRIDFLSAPGTVNAWYQPELNSISFPVAILQKPFYDPNYPAAVNYGAMGLVGGHELTHAFDDEGVQWGPTGALSTWIDANSSSGFQNMANCVINEYNHFCPLDNGTFCIDGSQTQGENIADNGGIRSAYRAYQSHVALYGPDPQLPDSEFGGYTNDQLFFLSFAQVWCQSQPTDDRLQRQILVDPHSPSEYRVFGTIQNFPQFRAAFNCPAGSKYAPKNSCQVWTSEVTPVTGIPPTTPLIPDLNIPQAQPINSSSNVSSKYEQYAQYLTSSIDTTRDPCNDFYAYACGNYQQPYVSIFDMMNNNFVTMAQAMQQVNNEDAKPIQQVKTYFNACRNALDNWDDMIKSGSQVIKHMQGFEGYTGVCFPLFDKKCNASWLNPTQLGRALGSLSGQALTDTFLTPYADTNWKDPQGPHPYALFVDQPTLANPWIYYIEPAWTELQASYQAQIVQLFQNFAYVLNITTLTMNDYNNVAMDIMNLEVILARELSTDEITRRNFARSYNLFTVDTAKKNYSFIDWPTYFKELFVYAQYEVQTYTNMPDFEFIVMETNKTDMLGGLLTSTNNYNINPTTLFNYLNFRLLLTHQDILYNPSPMFKASTKKWKHRLHKPVLGRPRYEPVRKQKDSSNDMGNQIQCAEATMNDMQYANARVFIDWIYPIAGTNRSRIRDSVQKIADSIVIGFRSMIDQIYWMSFASKKGAYDKIDKLVKNVAFPDFITNNTQLQNYYQALNFSSSDDYFTIVEQLKMYNYWLKWSYLNMKTQSREDFLGPPGIVNAWYQPELNSITFPAGILQPPFFDPDFPAAINFGAIGIVSGHELTHGFDDQGVQWDGTGVLMNWMDSQSTTAFKNMAECVIDEYNGFCPLSGVINPMTNQTYNPSCINGSQTQGENIADNGGIHASYRAYRNYINLHGPDPQLPGSFLSQYTQDQLFFLSYGQIWCQLPVAPDDTYINLLTDVHSPAKYRVQGAIQNFPAFRTAFNCPVGSKYAPAQHCDVWTSDIEPPNGTPAPNQVNLPTQPTIKADDPKYPVYKNALDFFKYSMNLSVDPCNNFYEYACGAYNKPLTFSLYRNDNQMKMANAMEALIAKNNTNSTAITKLLNFYSACKVAQTNMASLITNGSQILNIINGFKAYTGLVFQLYEPNQNYTALPNPTTLAKALAYLSVKTGVDTLVSPFVDVEPVDLKPMKYKVWIDQNTLTYDKSYYQGKTFNITKNTYLNATITLMKNFTAVMKSNLDDATISSIVNDFFNLEYMLANATYSTPDDVRRKFKRWDNPMNFTTANSNFNFIDWPTYVNEIFALTNSPPLTDNTTFTAIFMEVDVVKQLSMDIQVVAKFSPNLIVNYLFFRLLSAYQQFVPQPQSLMPDVSINDFTGLGIRSKRYRPPPNIWARKVLDAEDDIKSTCALDTQVYLQYANARIFTDYLYPDQTSRDNIRSQVGKIIRNILSAFQGMLDQLEWLDLESKSAAFDKVGNLTVNIAYPDFIIDNAQLDQYYNNLTFSANDYFTMISDLTPFNYYLQYSRITTNAIVDHKDFLGAPGTVNAWYQPELNSITFPEGILRQPYFDPDWPASINYGAMGLVAGHELSHGYDDGGVQYNAYGGLVDSWMTPESYGNFTEMAECVINEYGNFTALDCNQYQPCELNGDNTQGENIADNGGIHSSYRAYRNHIALNGPDPLLPDLVFSQFNHDQLFFLSFAQVWCQAPAKPDAIYKQILTDPHSPSLYRIFGTLQNFPAFRSAFNCPLGSAYAPKDHCSVWVPSS